MPECTIAGVESSDEECDVVERKQLLIIEFRIKLSPGIVVRSARTTQLLHAAVFPYTPFFSFLGTELMSDEGGRGAAGAPISWPLRTERNFPTTVRENE